MPNLWPPSPGDVVTRNRRLAALSVFALVPMYCCGQQNPDGGDQGQAKHVLWIIPNFRTSPELREYKPIAPREKFRIASEDTFDRGTIVLAAAFAGENQISRSNRGRTFRFGS